MEAVLEGGDHAEVASPAAQRPEQVGVVGLAGDHELAVGGDDVGRDQAVAGHAVGAPKPALATAERQPGDPGRRHDPTGRGEAEELGLAIEIPPGRPAAGTGGARRRVDPHPAHRRQVDHEPAVAGPEAGHVVPPAANRQRQLMGAGEPDARDDVGHPAARHDQRRTPIDHPVPDPCAPGRSRVSSGEMSSLTDARSSSTAAASEALPVPSIVLSWPPWNPPPSSAATHETTISS